ncbi:MAG: hypothetical protein CML68_04875 [Rhodobacteraceae bacterium]|nr:hypothetical protein [Paracoccaceae bacterium]
MGRVLWRHICRLTLLGAFAALLAVMFVGQTLTAPAWLRDMVSERVTQALDGHRIEFAEMHFVIRKGWRPRVGVSDLRITDPDGLALLDLSSAEASLAMRPLLRGQVNPKKITLTGAQAVLRRGADGAVMLDFGDSGQVVEEAASLPELIEHWEERLLTDPLTALTEVELTQLTLRYDDVRSGRSWTIDDGRFLLERHGDRLNLSAGINVLSGRSYAATVEASYASSIRSRAASFGFQITDMAAEDIALQSPALGWLEPLRAPISGALRGGIDDSGALLDFNATLSIGEGVLQPTEATRPIPFRGARSYFSFDPARDQLTFHELSVDSAWGSGSVEGRAWLSGLEDGRLEALVGQFSVGALVLNPADVYPEPLKISGAHADFQLKLNPFSLTLGEALIRDGDNPVHLDGKVLATPEGWRYAINGRIEEIEAARLLEIWPQAALVKPRKWVNENVEAGRLQDVDWAVRGAPEQAAPDIYADFEFEDGALRFSKNMPLLTGASGQASLVDHRLVAIATSGQVEGDAGGPVDITGTSFIVPDLRVKPGTPAILRITAQASPTAVLSLLDRPPLSVLSKANLPVNLAEGQLEVAGTLALPMQPTVTLADMEYHARGTIRGVSSSVLVPDHTLEGETLRVFADTEHVEISGVGAISGVPAEFTWTQPLGDPGAGSQVAGRVMLSKRAAQTFRLGLPDDLVSGEGWADFTLDLKGGSAPRIALSSNLDGLGLSVPSLGWALSRGAIGSLEVAATLGAAPQVDRLSLQGAGLRASGQVRTKAGGQFDRVVFDSLRLGGWLNVSGALVGRGAGRTPAITVTGGTLDLPGATFGSGGSGAGEPPPITARLDRLQIADGLALTAMQADLTTAGGLSGTFTGRMNGGTALSGKVVPEGGRSAFQINASDAGGIFRDAGILKQAYGGALNLILRPAAGAGSYDGTLRVTNTSVREGSGVGALLNTISLVGLIDELSGNGLSFGEVDARFHLSPSRLTLLSASAIGPSVGISLDGIYDIASATVDMQGVLSPLYAINIIGSVMTRKGEGLIGINFNLRGPAADPKISVNPLSALAPGFLRELFRKPAPTVQKNRTDPAVDAVPSPGAAAPLSGVQNRPKAMPGEDR